MSHPANTGGASRSSTEYASVLNSGIGTLELRGKSKTSQLSNLMLTDLILMLSFLSNDKEGRLKEEIICSERVDFKMR